MNYAGLDDQTHKHRSNYHLYSIYDRNCKAATVYENKRPFPEQLREDTLVTLVTNGTVFSFFFSSYFFLSVQNFADVVLSAIASAMWFSHTYCNMFLGSVHVILHCKVCLGVPLW